jgi:hypothetical protein
MSVSMVEQMTEPEARRITERIRSALDRISTSWADLADRIGEAYTRRADLALGYDSWESYAQAELKPSEGIAAEVRRELVGLLSARGMSTRAIAPTVGASHMAVQRDRESGVTERYTSPAPAEGIDYATGKVLDTVEFVVGGEAVSVRPEPKIIGQDGKSYTRPTQTAEPRRAPLRDGFRDAALDLGKIVGRLERLTADDRLSRNKQEVARYANDLQRAIEALQRIAAQLI